MSASSSAAMSTERKAEEAADAYERELAAMTQLEAAKRRQAQLRQLRQCNAVAVEAKRAEYESVKASLKSDLKRTTALEKKLKNLTEDAKQSILRDIDQLNLTLFVEEIAKAVVDTKFRPGDVPAVVELCQKMHQRYAGFTPVVVQGLQQHINTNPRDDKEAVKNRRVVLRMLIELTQVGVFTDYGYFLSVLRSCCGLPPSGGDDKPNLGAMDVGMLSTFVKYGAEDLCGLASRKLANLLETTGKRGQLREYMSDMVPEPLRNRLRSLVELAFHTLSQEYVRQHKELKKLEKRFERDSMMFGSLSDDKQHTLEERRREHERLLTALTVIADGAGFEMPELPQSDEEAGAGGDVAGISVWDGGAAVDVGNYGPFDDPETRSFYEDLPDLLAMVPLSALGLTPEQAEELREQWRQEKEKKQAARQAGASAEGQSEQAGEASTTTTATATTGVEESKASVADQAAEPMAMDGEQAGGEGEDGAVPMEEAEEGEEADADAGSANHRFLTLLEELPECVTKERIDDFAVRFCYLQSKGARRKLAREILFVPRQRLELIPLYARLVATLSRIWKDIAPPVLKGVLGEFMRRFREKNQLFIESKIKNIRFVAELVKFGIAPPIEAFRCFKLLLGDFTHHNVDLCAVLVETCGRFLYKMPHTGPRMEAVLEQMMRLRRSKNLDLRSSMMVEAAFYSVKPPERQQKKQKSYTLVQQYVRHLLFEKLNSKSVELVIRQLRKLPWNDESEDLERFVVKQAIRLSRTKFIQIPNLCDALAGLVKFRRNLVIRLVDTVCEELQRMLEDPFHRQPQRAVGLCKLLGELYNFSLVSSPLVFDMLYRFIHFGHLIRDGDEDPKGYEEWRGGRSVYSIPGTCDPRRPSQYDPPFDYFRIQLVCTLLDTCGSYYVRGRAKEKLRKYMVYFQRYLFCKPSIPVDIEFNTLDLMDTLEQYSREAAEQKSSKSKKSEPSASELFTIKRFETFAEIQAEIETWEKQGADDAEADGDGDADDEEEDYEEPSRQRDEDGEAGRESDEESEGDAESDSDDDDDDSDDDKRRNDEEDESYQAVKLLEAHQKHEEDEEFENAFKALMKESLESNRARQVNTDNMALPAVIPEAKSEGKSNLATGPAVAFRLLRRDPKGRVQAHQVLVPEETNLAKKLQENDEALRLQQQRLKERVLTYQQIGAYEAEEEPLSDSILSRPFHQPIVDPQPRGSRRERQRFERQRRDGMGLNDFLNETRQAETRQLQRQVQRDRGT